LLSYSLFVSYLRPASRMFGSDSYHTSGLKGGSAPIAQSLPAGPVVRVCLNRPFLSEN